MKIHLYKTRLRITVAKMLYLAARIILGKDKKQITRSGIRYEVDLTEGIDLSLFLFGGFQKYITNNELFKLNTKGVIFDIGANFGIMSLQFAKAVPGGQVYSFEPTHYALKKLNRNLKLNPKLSPRITTIQTFISDKTRKDPGLKAYSSWKVDGVNRKNTHPVHLGNLKEADGIKAINLDDFCKTNKIKRLDFIKIDTDGHEVEVLEGAKKVVAKYQPLIIFEVGDYVLKEKGLTFEFFLNYFNKMNYVLFDAKSKKLITTQNYRSLIPLYYTIDILAIPKKNKLSLGLQ